jgi:uncharacterized membrane protein YhaH (DUF805 family)
MTAPSALRQEAHHSFVWLALFALAYGLLHHQGFVLGRLGTVGQQGTRWADWIDLVTPYLVVGPAAVAMATVGASRNQWLLFAVGAIAYTQGHGIHLAANSIGNDLGASGIGLTDVTHLWDEVMGHYVWYGGLAVMVAALALAFRPLTQPRRSMAMLLLTLLFGVTYASNALEGHTAVMALITSLGFVAWSLMERRGSEPSPGHSPAAGLLGWVFLPSCLVLGFYGLWHRGFPEPTSVGWNPLGP